jgi:hypothetical protein
VAVDGEPKHKKLPKVKVTVVGGPWGRPVKYPAKNKRGWSISKPYWQMHGYTKTTLPPIEWVGATRYNLVMVGDTPYYVYDPQVELCQRILSYRWDAPHRAGQGRAISVRPQAS